MAETRAYWDRRDGTFRRRINPGKAARAERSFARHRQRERDRAWRSDALGKIRRAEWPFVPGPHRDMLLARQKARKRSERGIVDRLLSLPGQDPRRNPGGQDVARLALWGVVGVAAWQLAGSGALGPGITFWARSVGAWLQGDRGVAGAGRPSGGTGTGSAGGGGSAAPAAPVPSASDGWRRLDVLDLGGFPVEWRDGVVRQVRARGGTNTYRAGDVFAYPGGGHVQFVGGSTFVDTATGFAVGVGVH